MVDISKCANDNCSKKEKCYRYLAPDSLRQSYCCFKPNKKTNQCKHFLPVYKK